MNTTSARPLAALIAALLASPGTLHAGNAGEPARPNKVRELQSKWDAWNASQVRPLGGGGKASAAAKPVATAKKKTRRKAKAE
jgi:hypothetical protein